MVSKLQNLDLFANNIVGTIPTEIGMVSMLNDLKLYDNKITGTIPSEFGMVSTLRNLELYANNINGTIPTEVGVLQDLQTLALHHNNINGTIPSELGMMFWLINVRLHDNILTGKIPSELGKAKHIEEINLDSNLITGTIPSEIGQLIGGFAWFGVLRLILSNNSLTGTIPSEIGSLPQLEQLHLFTNRLSGTIPTEVGNLKALEATFNLSSNLLTGTVPSELGLVATIKKLDLSRNGLKKSLLHLGESTSYTYLNVSHNVFTSFPFNDAWRELETFDLSNNNIFQKIPENLAPLSSLKDLFISNNYFYGSVPNSIRSLVRMERLHLDHNALYGTIPDDILSLVRLRELKLSHTRQGRQCFHHLWECSMIIKDYKGGDLCCNRNDGTQVCADESKVEIEDPDICLTPEIYGTIPVGFSNTPYLRVLELSNNALTGNIPPEIGALSRLEVLDLTNNTLTGSIPSALGALADATVLLRGNEMIRGQSTNTKIAPLSVCSNMHGLDLLDDPTWCPPERNLLREFYEDAKGQEWTIATGWVDEFSNHCDWYGVECNEEGKIVNLTLGNVGLSGRISSAIVNLTSLEKVDFHDNDLKGSIPSQIGNLLNLSSFIISYNRITGTIPDRLADLSQLQILHLHGNRLQGTVPRLSSKGHTKSSFITDCGSPSVFDVPLDCPSCTMCCNSRQECDITKSKTDFGMWSSVLTGSAVATLLLASTTLTKAICSFICSFNKSTPSTDNEHYTIGKESVYSFFLSSSVSAWALATTVLAVQALCFGFFIDEASLEFGSDKLWRYSFLCPRNNPDCRNTSEVTPSGWIFFALFAFVYLLCDMLNGLKLIWSASKHGLSQRGFQSFIGGCALFTITALALYATAVYNVATSRSNLDMIFNTVILLFVNDLDEKLFTSLHVISPEWLEVTTRDIAANFGGDVRMNVQYAAANHQLRDQQSNKIKNIDKNLGRKNNAIKTVEARHTKLKKRVLWLEAKQDTENENIKKLEVRNQELSQKVEELVSFIEKQNRRFEELVSFREEQNRRFEYIEMNLVEVEANNKRLKEKVAGFEADQEVKKREMGRVDIIKQGLEKKVEGLESELKNFRSDFQKFVGKVENST